MSALFTPLALRGVTRYRTPGGSEVLLQLELTRETMTTAVSVPLTFELDGNPLPPLEVQLEGTRLVVQHRISLGDRRGGGQGRVTIPSDANPADNAVYFVFGDEVPLKSRVAVEQPALGPLLRLAAAPSPTAMNQTAELTDLSGAAALDFSQVALLVWQGAFTADEAAAKAVRDFVESGGALVLLPGAEPGPAVFAGLTWGDEQTAKDDAPPFSVAHWNDTDGPLANTSGGESLPLPSLQVYRRRQIAGQGEELASFADGVPFLVRARRGQGQVVYCATLPDAKWSTLGDGTVLVPMLQRLLREGGKRLAPPRLGWCGEAIAAGAIAAGDWRPLDEQSSREFPLHAGLYRHEAALLALNRPPREDDRERFAADDLPALFGGVPFRSFQEKERSRERLQSEIWRFFIIALLLALTAEALLILPARAPEPPQPDREGSASV